MRTVDQIVADLVDATKQLDGETALRVILLAQELAEAKAERLFQGWKKAEEARRG